VTYLLYLNLISDEHMFPLRHNPTDRGRGGSKLHGLVDPKGMPSAVALAGANGHDGRLIKPAREVREMAGPSATEAQPRHPSLDKTYDVKRVEHEALAHHYTPHIRRIGEKKRADSEDDPPARR
jgi:putative transposase